MYSKVLRTTVGHFDDKPISPQYQKKVNHFRKQLVKKCTVAELAFKTNIANVVSEEARTPYITQRVFHITDEIAFIADFYFKKFKVAVEIDGRKHYYKNEKDRDIWRDGLLHTYAGIHVIRFSNKAVLERRNEVFNNLVRFLAEQENATPSHRKYLRKIYSDILP